MKIPRKKINPQKVLAEFYTKPTTTGLKICRDACVTL
jgi:hypothetical protein